MLRAQNVVGATLLVFLAVYDLTPQVMTVNDMMSVAGGIFHLGVLACGEGVFQEFSFGMCGPFRARSTGISGGHIHRDYVYVGQTHTPMTEAGLISNVMEVVQAGNFQRGAYDLLSKNCVDFSNALVFRLTGNHIPEKYRVAAQAGKAIADGFSRLQGMGISIDMMSCVRALTGNSPPGTQSTPSDVIMLRELPAASAVPTLPARPQVSQTPPARLQAQVHTPLQPQFHSAPPVAVQSVAIQQPFPAPATHPVSLTSPFPSQLSFQSPHGATSTQRALQHSATSTGRMGTPSYDRSRSRGLQPSEDTVVRTLFPVPEQLPSIGQAPIDWIRQEVKRGRVLATQGVNANTDMTNLIRVQRIAELFFAGNARAAQRHVAEIRHSI
jgi:hypothetical protein